MLNIYFVFYLVRKYLLVEHQGLNMLSSFFVQMLAIPVQAYSVIHATDNWFIKAWTIAIWIDAIVFYHGIYKHGIKK